ncbi:MAG: flagellar motor stator protein MotA [Rickettsiales bacterium]|nr:flagellar motor stator protein MotA [Rickettsiales bacterium]
MLLIIGYIMVLSLVFGGYALAGGKFGVIIYALPFEAMMIGGASIGAFLAGNQGFVVKATLKDLGKAIKGPKWQADDYKALLNLLFTLTKTVRVKGLLEIETHIENPKDSELFKPYQKIVADHFAIDFICDTLRLMTMNMEDPYQVEDNMEKQITKHHHEALMPAGALSTMSDGLPAIGIVAAVLGVIKTMASVTEPPEILGGMIAGALVGTFLGVFLSYCFVGPLANKISQVNEEAGMFYSIIRDVFVCHLHGQSPQVAVEVGRGNVPSHFQPSFAEMENAFQNLEI